MDQEKATANLKKLLDYTFNVILPSHGEPIMENARQKLETLIAKAA
jgi:hypothetical protein